MMIDVSDLLRKKITKKEVKVSVDNSELFRTNKEVQCAKPVEFTGELSVVSDLISLEGNLRAELSLQCSRCMEKFQETLELSIHEEFSNNLDNEDDMIIFIDSDSIDITEVIENNIIMNLPIKKLCSEDCKGLCQHCGTNLNISTCSCGNNEVDPRLAQLKDLFSAD
jgi:uncharacterized protein